MLLTLLRIAWKSKTAVLIGATPISIVLNDESIKDSTMLSNAIANTIIVLINASLLKRKSLCISKMHKEKIIKYPNKA